MSAAPGGAAGGRGPAGPGDVSQGGTGLDGAPGAVRSPDRGIVLNPGRARRRLRVVSRSDRPVRVSSHYPFWRVNPRLEFDRQAAAGLRLDIPAGTSVRWAPGEVKTVDLVAAADQPASGPRAGGAGPAGLRPDGMEAPGASAPHRLGGDARAPGERG